MSATWVRMRERGHDTVSARAGHTLTAVENGFVLLMGMDGRRDEFGNPVPNNESYLLRCIGGAEYEWIPLDATGTGSRLALLTSCRK